MTLSDDYGSDPSGRAWPMRGLMQAGFAILAIGALSLFARERPNPRAIANAAEDVLSGPAFVPQFVPKTAGAARPLVVMPDGGFRYVIDDAGELDPSRPEPPRLNPANGRREDVVTRGAFPVIDTPYLRLTVTEAAADEAALFVTLARRAADGPGLFVARTGERGRLVTKFGPVETVETTLKLAAPDGGSRICAGFVSRPPASVQIDGWLCAPLGQAPEPKAIACALDKLVRNGQASADADGASMPARTATASSADCAPTPLVTQHTGSIGRSRPRNKAEVRQNTQAKP